MIGPPPRIRLLLADHDRRIRELRTKLLALLPEGDIEVVAQAATGPQALAMAIAHRPDVVVADLDLPGLDGIRVAEALGSLLPNSRAVLVTARADATGLTGALAAGVSAFLPKAVSVTELAAVVRAAPAGRCHVDPGLLGDAISTAGEAALAGELGHPGTALRAEPSVRDETGMEKARSESF
ncbi:response regulator transcription factor [Streptomyces kaniharaensis]|uniref:Response regulator transcription factor n=1 Tax=Streptomyces kaniharaensis TaxID=212423 RepID=A0A6N7KNB1_9ACTN|nr:response regulator transcription factor [Streptomyces kaniharaensis]MQS12996.1 response regulator transcription factor [Streptomyces kaniharaensis]